MNATKVTAPHVTAGMTVRSKYLGDGKQFYTIATITTRPALNRGVDYIVTVAGLLHPVWNTPEWVFSANSKFEIQP
jgi:hypothetical protein